MPRDSMQSLAHRRQPNRVENTVRPSEGAEIDGVPDENLRSSKLEPGFGVLAARQGETLNQGRCSHCDRPEKIHSLRAGITNNISFCHCEFSLKGRSMSGTSELYFGGFRSCGTLLAKRSGSLTRVGAIVTSVSSFGKFGSHLNSPLVFRLRVGPPESTASCIRKKIRPDEVLKGFGGSSFRVGLASDTKSEYECVSTSTCVYSQVTPWVWA